MRAWSEFEWHKGKLAENAGLLRDYDIEIGVSVTQKKMKHLDGFAKKMYSKDVDVNLWPLNGSYMNFVSNGYWVNNYTVDKTVQLLKDLEPVLKAHSNVKNVALDMEEWPLVGRLGNKEVARDKLEASVDTLQKDLGKNVVTMQWYWPGMMNSFNLPIPRNANKRLLMVYPSMSLTRFASERAREKFIGSAVDYGVKKYGKVDVDIGASDTGVYKHLLFPFNKLFEYGNPKKMREDMNTAITKGASSVGFYNLDSMTKNLEGWLKGLYGDRVKEMITVVNK